MKAKHIILVYDNIQIEEIYRDFSFDKRVTIVHNFRQIKSPVLKFLRRIHFSHKINQVITLPFKQVWSRQLSGIRWNPSLDYYIIFLSSAIFPMNPRYLMKMKKKHSLHYILLMMDDWDSYYGKKTHSYISQVSFDYIFSFDPRDVEKRHFLFTYIPYSMLSTGSNEPPQYDLFYIGTIYNDDFRLNRIFDLFGQAQDKNVDFQIMLSDVEKSMQRKGDNIIYLDGHISYASSLDYTCKTNCILEILKTTQTGATLRYYEAVCYNKKLLTNNKNVVNLPFYNPDYMHVFEKPEDIDWEWVKERIPVDYHYDGRFSPTHLIDKIIELEEEKERQENAEKEAH